MTARQTAVKAIHEDNLNLRNPSILAKLLNNYANQAVNDYRERAIEVVGSCSWAIIQSYDDEYYETSCGQTYCIMDGTMEENSYKYCQACGKEIKLNKSENA